jgi:hypothetical protein
LCNLEKSGSVAQLMELLKEEKSAAAIH